MQNEDDKISEFMNQVHQDLNVSVAVQFLIENNWNVDHALQQYWTRYWKEEEHKKQAVDDLVSKFAHYLSTLSRALDTESHHANPILLETFLSQKGKRIQTIKGDGNCLFRAISMWLVKRESIHETLRQAACDWMQRNLNSFIDTDRIIQFKQAIELKRDQRSEMDYIRDMQRDGEWGDMACIIALSRELSIEFQVVFVYSNRDNVQHVLTTTRVTPPADKQIMTQIWLAYDGTHYNLIVDKNW